MSISKEFEQAVKSGNIELVRIMLKNDLRIDPTFKLFNEMARYAKGVLGGKLYDKHDGDELKFDASAWNEDYLNLQMVKVVNNFSIERIDLLEKMIAFIYKDEVKKASAEHSKQNVKQDLIQTNGAGISQQVKGPPMSNNYAADRGCNRSKPTAEHSEWVVKYLKMRSDALLKTLYEVSKHGTWERDIKKLERETDELKKAIESYQRHHA